MRISTGYQFDSQMRGVSNAQRRLVEAQARATTGKRVSKPSDDPTGAASIVRMNALKASLGQYKANGTAAKGILGSTENALSDMNDLAKRAYEIGIRGANETTTAEARTTMASEIAEMQRRLVDLGNSKDPVGGYLFAGLKNDTAPFKVVAGALVYSGDNQVRSAEVSADQTLKLNTPGTPLVTDLYANLETLRQALLGGNPETISKTGVAPLQKSVDSLNLERAGIGNRLNTLSDIQTQHTRREDELTTRVSDVEEVDLSQAIMDYRLAESAYEAALNVASQGFRLGLVDFIRG